MFALLTLMLQGQRDIQMHLLNPWSLIIFWVESKIVNAKTGIFQLTLLYASVCNIIKIITKNAPQPKTILFERDGNT